MKRARPYLLWSADEDAALERLWKIHTHEELGQIFGRTCKAVRNRCHNLGLVDTSHRWTAEDLEVVRAAYTASPIADDIDLPGLARRLGRSKPEVCTQAKKMGLTNQNRPRMDPSARKVRVARFTPEELKQRQSDQAKQRIQERGHPKGMLGKKHSDATKAVISEMSRAMNARRTPAQKAALAMKAMKTKVANGTQPPERLNATWKAGWREIGGKRKFYRSRWEANYARYLEWLKANGQILDWSHEPRTYWFEGVKRGSVSYLPDFEVIELNGSAALHEVKGWMDDRSRVKLKRMAKYHPTVRMVLVQAKEYKAIGRAVSALIGDWE